MMFRAGKFMRRLRVSLFEIRYLIAEGRHILSEI